MEEGSPLLSSFHSHAPSTRRWVNRLVPNTWVLYGISASQLSDVTEPLTFAGTTYTVSGFLEKVFGYTYDMRWWCVLIGEAHL